MTHVPPPPVIADESRWYRRFSFNNAWEVGWSTFKAKYGYLLKATLIYAIIYLAASFVAAALDTALVGPDAWIDPVTTLMGLFLLSHMAVGFVYVGIAAVRGREMGLDDLFIGFRRYWTVVGVSLLITVLIWLVFVPIAVLAGVTMASQSTGGAVLLIVLLPLFIAIVVAAIYISVRLWFAAVVAIDPLGPRPGVWDSIKLSWTITAGRALTLFILGLALGFLFLLLLLLLILPAIFLGAPLAAAVFGAAYAQIAAEDGLAPLESACVNCGYPNPDKGTCPECGFGATVESPA